MTIDQAAMSRIRWRCRRGLLELDIVLGRFIEHYTKLNKKKKIVFDTLLDMPDTNLWDMISGKTAAEQDDQAALIILINNTGIN